MTNPKKRDHDKSIFVTMSDEEIIKMAQDTDNKAAISYMVNKYRNLVKARACAYFLMGADREDLVQEGMIGLYKATRDYRDDKQSSFKAFAELCITRQIITAVKTANRQKHMPLNTYVSLNKPVTDEKSERTLIDILVGAKVMNPEELIIGREEFANIEAHMRDILSTLEWEVLMAYLDGKTYQEIGEDLHRHVKSIDNALQRVKRKVEMYLTDRQRIEDSRKDV